MTKGPTRPIELLNGAKNRGQIEGKLLLFHQKPPIRGQPPKIGDNVASMQSSIDIYLFHHGIIHIFDGLFYVDFIGIVGVKHGCLIFQVERFPK